MHVSRSAALGWLLFFLNSPVFAQFSPGAASLKSPDAFLPHPLGEQFTPHHLLTDYFEYLAANATSTMRLERYGYTNEARPLQIAVFSSPENIARLEQIRLNNLRLAGMVEGQPDLANPVAIVWLSMSVHGNEPSGSECSMALAYKLAEQSDPEVREWLKNTVVVVDPSVNPDGYDRYTHWNRMSSNLLKTPHPDSREHREPWPGGRVNHYYFDLNRDWAWATQTETRQRLRQYHRWLPHVHPDIHEQGINNPYYFAPAAEPVHEYVTPWQREFQTQIGKNNARYFDQNGWLYFTKEVFDLFYPSYGDTYPTFNGAIGMTYEQAGNSSAGRAIFTETDDTLTLHDRIAHHLTSSLSTIEVSSQNATKLVESFRAYYATSATRPPGQYKTFVISSRNDPNKVNALCQLLDQHQIRYGRAGAGAGSVKAFDYADGKEKTVPVQANDVVISAYQQKSVLLTVLFEPESRLSDSLTYDITAWSLPFAHGLEAYALKERLEPKQPYAAYKAPEALLAAVPYAWCVRRSSLADAVFVADLLQKGVKIRYAAKSFSAGDQQYAAGAYLISRGDNRAHQADLDRLVKAAAAKANVPLNAIFSGFVDTGKDFGSDAFVLIKQPQVAVLYGEEVDENAYGQVWYFFERELGYPLTPIPADKLNNVRLRDFTTLIVPNGYFSFSESSQKVLEDWIRQGGRVIAVDGGVRGFAGKDGFSLKRKEEAEKDTSYAPKTYLARERDHISEQLPGAIVRAKADNTHPLAFGFPDYYYSLKTNNDLYELPDNAVNVVYLDQEYKSYGFIGTRLKPRLKKSPIASVQQMGRGQVVYFVDNPLFRSFWQQGKVLFANALFF
jgi:Zinc carboxypeptidase